MKRVAPDLLSSESDDEDEMAEEARRHGGLPLVLLTGNGRGDVGESEEEDNMDADDREGDVYDDYDDYVAEGSRPLG